MLLTQASLSQIDQSQHKVEIPAYDRSALKTGVVMFGLGNFARSHFVKYLHDLQQQGEAMDYGIVGVSLTGTATRDNAKAQDGLYTLVADGKQATIVGTVTDVLYAPENPQSVIDQLASPDTRIVAMAMTANGYYLDSHGHLMMDHPDIQHDLTASQPKTFLGYMAHALKARRDAGLPGFTIQSLDNIVHNGDYTRQAVMTFINAWDPGLVEYVQNNTAFPNGMVDRIAVKTAQKHKDRVVELTGLQDNQVTPTEEFTQWVVEDNYINGRPAFENVGVQFVGDVTPYEIMKLRLLNVSHLGIACLGDLAGLKGIDETMSHKVFQDFMSQLMDKETGPTVPEVPGIDLPVYKKTLVERFVNPAVDDTTQRVATDAPLQVLVDTVRERLDNNQSIELLSLIAAAWLKRTRGGLNEKGGEIVVKHPLKDELARLGNEGAANSDPLPQLSLVSLFGDLGQDDRFVGPVAKYLRQLDTAGVEATMLRATGTTGAAFNPEHASTPRMGDAMTNGIFGAAATGAKPQTAGKDVAADVSGTKASTPRPAF